MHVAVIDIGKPDKNLGWAIDGARFSCCGSNLDACVAMLCDALRDGPLALGFESPLFVPMRQVASDLTKARVGECANAINRPFSAAPGASVLVTGLVVIPYVLAKIREIMPHAEATLDWRAPVSANSLLLFEAFVSNQRGSGPNRHTDDAKLAISAFQKCISNLVELESSLVTPICLNLLGAMLLRTGWTQDLTVLERQCLVVKV
ncbi:MAG: hypothetical protein RL274_6 [Pseudomonadota bacterium]|jgi:hypothetical protein